MQTSDSSSKHGEENYVAHLWILRLQDSLSCLIRSRMAASILLFYLPSIVSGLLLEWILKEHFITRGIHIALVWLALAPLLIQEAFRMLINFFDIHKHIFLSEKDWQEFKDAEVGRIQSSRYLVFGIPWTVVVVLIVLVSLFRESSIPVKV